MSGFTGMVVAPGSPHDCRKVSSKTPYVRLADPQKDAKPTRLTLKQRAVSEVAAISGFIWVSFRKDRVNSLELIWGFWVPEGKTDDWAMDTLIQTYEKAARK